MKRLLALAAACFVALSLLVIVVPAQADDFPDCMVTPEDCVMPDPAPNEHEPDRTPHGVKCINHVRWNQQHTQVARRTICPLVNSRDITFGEDIEALLDYTRGDNPGQHVKVYIDWIRLLRSNGTVLKDFNCDCWKDSDNSGSMSTSWYNACNDSPHVYSAKARYKIQWLTLPGQPTGQFFTSESYDVSWVPC